MAMKRSTSESSSLDADFYPARQAQQRPYGANVLRNNHSVIGLQHLDSTATSGGVKPTRAAEGFDAPLPPRSRTTRPAKSTTSEKTGVIKLGGVTIELKWLSLILLIVQNTVLVLAMRFSRTNAASNGKLYKSSTAVVMAELLKLAISTYGVYQERESKGDFWEFTRSELTNPDIFKLAVPGILYTIQNNLLFIALSNLEAAVYQVTYQLKILTTAMFSVSMLGRSLSMYQLTALVLLMMGVALVQLASSPAPAKSHQQDADGSRVVGVTCVLLACVSSGFAGVYTEKILKHGRVVSLFARNMQLAIFGTILGLFGVLVNDAAAVYEDGFFSGYTMIVWLVVLVQAGGGLMIAVVMKYADNILKGFATSISIVLSSVLSSLLFDFELTFQFVVGTSIVIAAVFLFGVKPRSKRRESNHDDAEYSASASVFHRHILPTNSSNIVAMIRV
ncbi:CMP-sialic acid transporter [Hondaea fermentalgiana]|uniref:CMP-sialic acid transporter n=1 Tax=Hondaea fermentalgiana TaxID=2315210 RepID=A0A2R5G4L0_9STRA|nr:CMP-sialic acid transporter [Hondaea fermentalgiana]|eukprot:GBG25962.1 CMP-sialic acid transporter [Hondaea fermentalgiana]